MENLELTEKTLLWLIAASWQSSVGRWLWTVNPEL